MACFNVAGAESSLGTEQGSEHLQATLKASNNHDDSLTLTTKFSLKTSAELPSGHLVVTPALTVKFSETRDISFNITECESHNDTIITWSLGDGGPNLNSFTLKAYNDIADAEVLPAPTFLWCHA